MWDMELVTGELTGSIMGCGGRGIISSKCESGVWSLNYRVVKSAREGGKRDMSL